MTKGTIMKVDELRKFAQEVRAAAGEQPVPVRILVDVLQVIALCDAAEALEYARWKRAIRERIDGFDADVLSKAEAAITALREAGIEP